MACFGVDRRSQVLCILVPLLTGGCIRPRADVRSSLEARVLPVPDHASPADAMVRPAVAERPQGPDPTLPPALESAPTTVPRPMDAAGPAPTAADATEEPTGQPLTLPEAIRLAFRLQPRLRAQLESIAQARGREDRKSTRLNSSHPS